MMNKFLVLVILIAATSVAFAGHLSDIDRTGTIYVTPKVALSFPMGALADQNYNLPAASWRKEGITVTAEAGYYITNSTIWGMEFAYTNFNAKHISAFPQGSHYDDSRVRIRRAGAFFQYMMIPNGKYRPFLKLGAGLFEMNRISLPDFADTPAVAKDYSLGAKPTFTFGLGFIASIRSNLSATVSFEAVSMNSKGSSWETTGATVGPLGTNMLYMPLYFGLVYHFADN